MYEQFFGLKEKPFNLNPDPDYLYMSDGHENTYTHLIYAISENKGFVIVTGEIGSGKTTLLNYLLHDIPEDIEVVLINNTHIPASQFIKLVCREFEIDVKGLDKAGMIDLFHDYLIDQFASKRRVVLIVDEAQNLTPKTMEEIRLLSNLESEKYHLLQIILVGQPELKLKLQRSDLQQLVQRVTVHCHLSGLSEKDVEKYIYHRMGIAGSKNADIFDEAAIHLIAETSRGIPRLINTLCDTALVYGYADGSKIISEQIIKEVVKERAAAGLFVHQGDASIETAVQELHDSGNYDNSDSNGSSKIISDRLNKHDDRLGQMESDLLKCQMLLEKLEEKGSGRDEIVIELFKLLKESMESRLNTILRFSERLK